MSTGSWLALVCEVNGALFRVFFITANIISIVSMLGVVIYSSVIFHAHCAKFHGAEISAMILLIIETLLIVPSHCFFCFSCTDLLASLGAPRCTKEHAEWSTLCFTAAFIILFSINSLWILPVWDIVKSQKCDFYWLLVATEILLSSRIGILLIAFAFGLASKYNSETIENSNICAVVNPMFYNTEEADSAAEMQTPTPEPPVSTKEI